MTAASEPRSPLTDGAPGPRERYRSLDNLKVALIAAVIFVHGLLGYVGIRDLWPYDQIQETTLTTASVVVLFALVGPFAFFMMALLFLVAGLLTPASVARKGPGRFVRDRLLRLGVPFAGHHR